MSLLRSLQRLFLFVILPMNKFVFPFFGLLLLLFSCKSTNKTDIPLIDKENSSLFPVTEFLEGQLTVLENSPVTPLKLIIIGDHVDSIWISRDDIRSFAEPFLNPVIDSASLSSYFNGNSFLDQTINSVTFSYDANISLPKDMFLRTINVYVNPEFGTISKVYLLKERYIDEVSTKVQLTWKTDEWCSIRTIDQKDGQDPEVKEEKVIWKFD